MEIKVLGTGCASCKALFATVREAVGQLGIEATVVKEEDLMKIMEYNVVDETVVSKGRKLSVEEVKELLK